MEAEEHERAPAAQPVTAVHAVHFATVVAAELNQYPVAQVPQTFPVVPEATHVVQATQLASVPAAANAQVRQVLEVALVQDQVPHKVPTTPAAAAALVVTQVVHALVP